MQENQEQKIKKSNKVNLRIFIITTIILLILVGILVYVLKQNGILKKPIENENKLAEEQENIIENYIDPFEEYGIFGRYYEKAQQKLETLTIEEKIAQLFIIGNSASTNYKELASYQFGGYLFFKEFFTGKTEQEVKSALEEYQAEAKIPLLIAVDEEGGNVVRVSSNKNLSETPFKSSSQIYNNGGFEAIKEDTINKSNFLSNLGINLNFAPVVDVANNPKDYMYNRALQQDKDKTAIFAKTVISASRGLGVSYTLKHFPGYGNNVDTHIGSSVDKRTYEDIYNNDLEPFHAGINEGAECIMVSHNIVTSIDDQNQASISPKIHKLLREELGFTGIIITDALNMGAIRDENTIEEAITKAITSGNDMIILSIDKNTTDKDDSKITYSRVIDAVKNALNNGTIQKNTIDEAVTRILAWKYYKELLD